MSSEQQQWLEVKENYLKLIEKNLAQVDHPKRSEILGNVREHLDSKYDELSPEQKNWESYQQIITEMGPPEEYAELLNGDNTPKAKTTSGINTFLAILFVIVLAAVGSYLIYTATETNPSVSDPVIYVNDLPVNGIALGQADCTADFVQSLLGPPKRIDSGGKMLRYTDHGLDLWFSGNGPLSEIHLNPGFKGKLDTGISLSSYQKDVFKVYGKPVKKIDAPDLHRKNDEGVLYQKGDASRIYYGNRGLIFWFKDDTINQIVVFKGTLSTDIFESNNVSKSTQKTSKIPLPASGADHVTPSQVTTNEVSEEQRSVWAYYRMGTVARHNGDAQEATKAYASIIKISAEQQEEHHKIISNMYLAEIASEIQKNKPLAIKRLQEAITAANSVNTAKMERNHAGVNTIFQGWLSYQLAKLEGRKNSAAKTSFNNSELEGIFLLAISLAQMSIKGTGFTFEQLAEDSKSPIDTDIALLTLAYGCLPDNGNPDFLKAEKYFTRLAQRNSYFASYAAVMLTKLQEEAKKESQRHLIQEEIERPQETFSEISSDQIFQLMENIKSNDGKVRQAAMRKLTLKAGQEGIKALEQAQKSPDKYTRYWSAIALSHAEQTSVKPNIHLLIEAMGEPDKSLWWEAACALNGSNPPILEKEKIGTLVAMAKCPKDRTVDRSGDMAEILGNCLSSDAEAAVPEIVNLLQDDNEYTKMNACIILRKMGPSAMAAFPELVKYLNCNDDAVQRFAIEAMKNINPKETEVLLKKRANEETATSQKRIAELVPQIPSALEKLDSPDVAIRRQGMNVFTLLQQEPEWEIDTTTETGKQVVSALIKAANDSNYSIRMRAKETLCTLHTVEAIPVYIDILNEKDNFSNANLKEQAAQAVEAIGPAAKDAVPALNKIASTDKGYVGHAARATLESICGDALYVPQLLKNLKSSQKEKRRSAIVQLGMIKSDEAKAAIPALIEILSKESEDEHCRIAAARTLAHMKAADAVPVLVNFSKEDDSRNFMLRSACIDTLGLMEDTAKPAIPALIEILKNKTERAGIRAKTARALGNLKAEEAIPSLTTILKQKGELADMGEDSLIRSNAAVALGLMGAKAKDAVPLLTECLADESTEVSKAASEAIKKIDGPKESRNELHTQ